MIQGIFNLKREEKNKFEVSFVLTQAFKKKDYSFGNDNKENLKNLNNFRNNINNYAKCRKTFVKCMNNIIGLLNKNKDDLTIKEINKITEFDFFSKTEIFKQTIDLEIETNDSLKKIKKTAIKIKPVIKKEIDKFNKNMGNREYIGAHFNGF